MMPSNRQITWTTIGLLAIALAPARGAEPQRTISVTGQGAAAAVPDLATIHTGVVTQATEATAAVKANNAAMTKIFSVLAEHQVADKDMQTSSFNVSILYRRDPRGQPPPEIEGYRVTNQLQVRVRKLDDLGKVLDALVTAGSNQVSGISFGIDAPTPVLNDARRRAMADALGRAQLYAQAAGVRAGKVLTISEQSAPIPVPIFQRAVAAAAEVPVAPGEQEFRVTLSVVFAIAEAEQ